MRQKIELAAAILVLAGLIIISRNVSKYVTSDQVKNRNTTVVLDAGHGGADPGKIGVNDVEEKTINLAIAKKAEELLKKEKIDVVMTREEDIMLAGQDGQTTKVGDMKARVSKINELAPVLAVSIHQNSYHQEGIMGSQVFYYSHSEEGKKAAEIMQDALLILNTENNRKAKANDTYYLLKRTEVPTIIVECGFLSNWEEAELLRDEEYQEKVAEAIVSGIKAYMEK
ncbi:MAG: N-acetylmuramoyl-L-alanine amidase [Eubacteriales bacterium]|nr:N-acetylmuramoyl-L-alanine amidase [Eubacteriales bacterium]